MPDRPDGCPRPARTKAAAIVAAAVKAGPAEIVPVAIIPVITRDRVNIPRASVAGPNAASHLSGRKVEGCCAAGDDSPAGSRSRASVAPAAYELAQPTRLPTAATERQQL